MIRNIVLLNLHSMNALPAAERWYWREHAPQSVRKYGPWMTRYEGFRAAPPAQQAERFGYYNYRMADVWFRDLEPMPGSGDWIWFQGQDRALGVTNPNERFGTRWTGTVAGPRPPLLVYIPALPTEDFLGAELAADARTRLRWFIVFAYPPGVSLQQGDSWFLNVHVPEAMRQPGLYRYFSYRTVQFPQTVLDAMSPQHPFQFQWSRVVEMWYEDYDAWTASVIDSAPLYTAPPWACAPRYPFLEPYSQFVSTFLLERPDWTKEDMRPYP